MKLTHLRIEQLKQFQQPVEVSGLESGINLFVGPNESGKSTLVRAIRAAFFERFKSNSVDDLRPWGDSSATPTIALEFDWQGEHWTLNKTFLGKKRCDLKVGQRQYSGDEAEEKLADLLGYQFASRGASKAEHWGVPGLLWVEQGSVQEVRESVDHAGDHLKSALSSSLGDVISTGGDELITQVEKERAILLTKTGQPTGLFKKVNQDCQEIEEKLERLNVKIEHYRHQVDELGRLRQLQTTTDAGRPWEAEREKIALAEARLKEVQALQSAQQRDKQALLNCQANQTIYRSQLQDFENQSERLVEREKTSHAHKQTLEKLQLDTPPLERSRQEADEAYQKARQSLDQARKQARYHSLEKERDQQAARQAELAGKLEEAQKLQHALQTLREEHQALALDERSIVQLKKLEEKRSTLEIQQKALATRLEYDLEEGKSLSLGGEAVSGRDARLLVELTELIIPDIGTLKIQPGGKDIAELRRQQDRSELEYKSLLEALGLSSLEEAEQRLSENRERTNRIQQSEQHLDILAPKGVDRLNNEYQLIASQLGLLTAQLEALPEPSSEGMNEEAAETALNSADAELKTSEKKLNHHKQKILLAEQASKTAEAEWQKLHRELNAADRQGREKAARDQLTDLKAEESRLQTVVRARQDKIDEANPDALQQDIERYTRSAAAKQEAARQREQQISALEIELKTLGAQGLEEERSDVQQEAARLNRRQQEMQRRADALELLLSLLREKRQALTRQLQAPLQKHLNHYLKLLFPGASLIVDEQLRPQTLTRSKSAGEEHGDVELLSYGAREQMGLISRLAYADLLQEAGRPTLIILDDALVHSDAARLEEMKRILFDAAQRHQILLFSCHPEKWHDLGVVPRDMQALKV